jgi:hypothetical protein
MNNDLKKLGRAQWHFFGGTYLPILSAGLVLFVGYGTSFFYMGIPMLAVGLYCFG